MVETIMQPGKALAKMVKCLTLKAHKEKKHGDLDVH